MHAVRDQMPATLRDQVGRDISQSRIREVPIILLLH